MTKQRLTTEKHCEILSDHARDKSKALYDAFKLFVQMFSGVIGGTVVVRLQYGGKIPQAFLGLSNWLAVLVVAVSAILLLDAFRSWLGYRRALFLVAGTYEDGKPVVPQPNLFLSGRSLLTMLAIMLLALVSFIQFNPLSIPN